MNEPVLLRVLDGLIAVRDHVVLVGGTAHRLFPLHPLGAEPSHELLSTEDIDFAAPLELGHSGAGDLVASEQAAGHLLVIDTDLETIFGGVAERCMTDVVKQRGGAHQPPRQGPLALGHQIGPLDEKGVEDAAGEVHGAESVAEAAVLGTRVDEEGEAELVDPAQSLHRPAADQSRLERIGVEKTVDRVAEAEHGRFRRSVAFRMRRQVAEGRQCLQELQAAAQDAGELFAAGEGRLGEEGLLACRG